MKVTFTARFKRWFGGISMLILLTIFIVGMVLLESTECLAWFLGWFLALAYRSLADLWGENLGK